ncbi:hypothetical protein Bca52824_011092 [Brassica carinata]|uniref:HTH myb-type domain-containing protein n=1 Tax=Brassica carinata TaxID=52824 RepID=A0A8X7WCV7_BRACI|nr:hypothetical protein Bca52824_011092 [Brassica carinata]
MLVTELGAQEGSEQVDVITRENNDESSAQTKGVDTEEPGKDWILVTGKASPRNSPGKQSCKSIQTSQEDTGNTEISPSRFNLLAISEEEEQLEEGKISVAERDNEEVKADENSIAKPIREEHEEEREEVFKEKKFQLWRENDLISNARFSDKKINNTLEIERDEVKSSNSLSMLLSPGMTTPEVETCLGLCLTSSSMVNGRKKLVASNSLPRPPPYLQQQVLRKQTRCWTPELHRRFVDALQHLGGPGVATPKQIREHMQEEGLTNDEVKSHLQKYRLHIRKSDSNKEKRSVVVLGFNWRNSSQEEEEEESGEGGESLKRSPLQLPSTTTTTCGDSSMEDAEDAKSQRRD